MNRYQFFADVVVLAHFAYALFVVLAMPLILVGISFRWSWVKNFWFRTIHFAMIAIVVVQSLLGIACPLTTLENFLRRKAGSVGYEGTFIGGWIRALLFVDLPTWALTLAYCGFGALVLATLLLAPPRRLSPRNHAN